MTVWLSEALVLAIHDEQLSEHGGASGLRDLDGLRSALARPHNVAAYGEPDVFDLAAAYAFGLARNHPFVDGTKRTSFVIAELFLALNGTTLAVSDAEIVLTWLRLAAGDIAEADLAGWLRAHGSRDDA
ncbi:MAG: type II toxin-antitoxin system death-on-curing family toxin [Methylobacteriaceae bacterium]|nr:type II toxin-antitoxin system death-on-curing family toxin [Methylobacteriaceae bacterium]